MCNNFSKELSAELFKDSNFVDTATSTLVPVSNDSVDTSASTNCLFSAVKNLQVVINFSVSNTEDCLNNPEPETTKENFSFSLHMPATNPPAAAL